MTEIVAATGLRSVVLDIEVDNAPSIALARRLGAERREPVRTEHDRAGIARTLAVFVLRVASAQGAAASTAA